MSRCEKENTQSGWMDESVPADPAWDKLEPHRLVEQHKLDQKRIEDIYDTRTGRVYDAHRTGAINDDGRDLKSETLS